VRGFVASMFQPPIESSETALSSGDKWWSTNFDWPRKKCCKKGLGKSWRFSLQPL
jgi:hypothetical protein